MCGFVGLFKLKNIIEEEKRALSDMSCAIAHRGPDENEIYLSDKAAFAFRRLSIIDLSSGTQPMEAFGSVGVFNGEIYNYLELRAELMAEGFEFKTNSEIEVLLALYRRDGENFLKKLRGMYAISIYDKENELLCGGRDSFGIKPLYYRVIEDGVLVSSEFKAYLWDCHGEPIGVDPDMLSAYFTFEYVPDPNTISKDVRLVPPGHSYVFDKNGFRLKQYREISFAPVTGSFDEKEKAIRKAVENSVKAHLLSDVPVGTFLSSGVDSAVVTAVASKLSPGIKAFTVAFGVDAYSEMADAEGIAARLDVEHVKLNAGLEDFKEIFEKMVWHLDCPFADPSTPAIYLICREASKHLKVVLSGEGSDELFGGYRIYEDCLSTDKIYAMPAFVKKLLSGVARAMPEGMKGKGLLYRGTTPLSERYVGNTFIMDEDAKKALLPAHTGNVSYKDITRKTFVKAKGLDTLTAMQFCDVNHWLPSDILTKSDRLSMAHSLEVRVPFMDLEVYEAARTLAPEDKLSHGTTKYVLRRAFRDLIGEETFVRAKKGYPVPVRYWLKNDLFDWARDIIKNNPCERYINTAEALRLLEEHGSGKKDNYHALWAIVCFMTWYRLYILRESPKN